MVQYSNMNFLLCCSLKILMKKVQVRYDLIWPFNSGFCSKKVTSLFFRVFVLLIQILWSQKEQMVGSVLVRSRLKSVNFITNSNPTINYLHKNRDSNLSTERVRAVPYPSVLSERPHKSLWGRQVSILHFFTGFFNKLTTLIPLLKLKERLKNK